MPDEILGVELSVTLLVSIMSGSTGGQSKKGDVVVTETCGSNGPLMSSVGMVGGGSSGISGGVPDELESDSDEW